MTDDIRWIQRFNNFKRALIQLDKAMVIIAERDLNELEQQGVIQAFEYNFELAWNVLKDFYTYQGEEGIQGSRDAIRLAFKRGLIVNGEAWFDMIKKRALTSQSYNEDVVDDILEGVIHSFYPEFVTLKQTLTGYMREHALDD
jgi:nucleotidyltransferase substrate binding protein (TIGR01987 family)